MKQRRTFLIVISLVVAVVLCLACAGCGILGWFAYQGKLPIGQAIGRTPVSIAVPTSRPSTGELRLAGPEPVTLDPALAQDNNSATYLVEIYSGLVALDQNLQVVPDLAERWELSADGRTYTFYLRENARFQDGRIVTAADVEYSLDRACSPELHSNTASTYLFDIVGAAARQKGEAARISGLQVIDERTLSLTIDAPKAYFLSKLTYPVAFVVDRKDVERGRDWYRQPNGTGPFRLASWGSDRIVLERNPHYYNGAARLQRVSFVLSGGSPITMYENNQLDIVYVGLFDVERVQDPSNALSAELTVVPRLDVQYLGMNVEVPPFDDPLVRRAFAQALDRKRLANVVLKKTVLPAVGILPPGIPGYRQDFAGLAYDPEAALQSLRASRYRDAADLPEVVLHISGEGGQLPAPAEAIVAMLRESLGVEVRVEMTPWARFLDDLNRRRLGFYMLGWIADYPDAQDFMDILFHSQSAENHMAYSNPEVDRLLEKARVEADRDTRLVLYQQAEELVVMDAPWVPLWHSRDYVLVKPYVKGVVFTGATRPWLKDVYLEY
ncbi:MAG: peptide ABC transporter substrate-binding protein [Anaerolineae bacterium]